MRALYTAVMLRWKWGKRNKEHENVSLDGIERRVRHRRANDKAMIFAVVLLAVGIIALNYRLGELEDIQAEIKAEQQKRTPMVYSQQG